MKSPELITQKANPAGNYRSGRPRATARYKAIAAILIAILASISATSCRKGADKTAPAETAPAAPAAAHAAKVEITQMPETYIAMGAVAPRGKSVLSSKIMGRIISVNVNEGDAVTAGQQLVVIDSSDIETQVRQAESGLRQSRQGLAEVEATISAAAAAADSARANADLARKTYERYLDLKNKKSVSQQEFDQAQAQLRMAEAGVRQAEKQGDSLKQRKAQALSMISQAGDAVAQAKIMRGYATVVSPISGVVVEKSAEPGQLASPGAPLVAVEYNTGYRLEAAVDESRIENIRLQGAAEVEIPALGGKNITGKIVEISQAVDSQSRSFIAKIALPDDPRLRSGMFGRAKFTIGKTAKIMIPSAAVVRRGAQDGVYVLDKNNIARFRAVKLGAAAQGGLVEAYSGLSAGDLIITSDPGKISDGRKVKVN